MKLCSAVYPVADFGIRFPSASKAVPKELLPIVDKPLIHYAAEEAIAAGTGALIFISGRNKRAVDDHSDTININAQKGSVETVRVNGHRFDCKSVDEFMRAAYHHEYQWRQDH